MKTLSATPRPWYWWKAEDISFLYVLLVWGVALTSLIIKKHQSLTFVLRLLFLTEWSKLDKEICCRVLANILIFGERHMTKILLVWWAAVGWRTDEEATTLRGSSQTIWRKKKSQNKNFDNLITTI